MGNTFWQVLCPPSLLSISVSKTRVLHQLVSAHKSLSPAFTREFAFFFCSFPNVKHFPVGDHEYCEALSCLTVHYRILTYIPRHSYLSLNGQAELQWHLFICWPHTHNANSNINIIAVIMKEKKKKNAIKPCFVLGLCRRWLMMVARTQL